MCSFIFDQESLELLPLNVCFLGQGSGRPLTLSLTALGVNETKVDTQTLEAARPAGMSGRPQICGRVMCHYNTGNKSSSALTFTAPNIDSTQT